jgi:type II secretory pathway component PulC
MELVTQQETLDNTPYGLEVIGIVVSEDLKQAIIGTDHVLEGEIVPGTKIRVKKINLNSVEFEEDGKTWIQKTRERQEVEGVRK